MPALYLLRHGVAEDVGDDPPLSAEGARLMEAQAIGMARLGISFQLIVSSPLRRARDTARIVADVLGEGSPGPGTQGPTPRGTPGPVETLALLAPGCRLEQLDGLFRAHPGAASVLLVGHQPDMGRMAAALTGAGEALALERGALCCLEVAGWPPRPPAVLQRLLLPEFLRSQATR